MADFLLELLTEEMPARMQAKATDDLARLFAEACAARGLAARPVAHVTPRRLALLVHGLPTATAPTREERRGPRADAPEAAIMGFLKSAGVAREALQTREDAKGRFLYAVIARPGRAVGEVLAEAVGEAVGKLPWPKSMRWGAASASMDSPRWVRPLVGVVALLDESVLPLTVLGVAAGRTTCGHRFLSHCEVVVANPRAYAAQMRDAHVIVDAAGRRRAIADGARACAEAAGLVLIEDEVLVAENAGLTEWPVALLGRFDPTFLELPREVIQLTMRTNQKYFACADAGGALAPAFVCVANIPGADGGAAIVEGNRRVLAARLSDARFFWKQDRARPLADYLPRLEQVVFHEKLGTMREKAKRVARLARWLVESGAVPGADPDMAERAGLMAKADLVTAMVDEFPELQGTMGGYYALTSGEAPAVAAAIRDHYKPVGPSDLVPVEPVSVAVALADKLDTLVGFFGVDEIPTGSRDPYALRRSSLGVVKTIVVNGLRLSFDDALTMARGGHGFSEKIVFNPAPAPNEFSMSWARPVYWFLIDRLKVQQREAGVRHDLIDAVFALGGEDDIVRLLARVRALQAFAQTEDGVNLLAGYKRAANILAIEAKRDGVERFNRLEGDTNPADVRFSAWLYDLSDEAKTAVAAEDFTRAMAVLAQLRGPIDAYFEAVMVNDPDPAVRFSRLALLQRFVDAVHRVADFSRIEG